MRWTTWAGLGLVLAGCSPGSGFDFTVSGGPSSPRHVSSGVDAVGSVDEAGRLRLEDASWALTMDLRGLEPGSHGLSIVGGAMQLTEKATSETYSVALGGLCTAWLDAHGSGQGSTVVGYFACSGLTSATGDSIELTNGAFHASIEAAGR